MTRCPRAFVYGTLKRNEPNHHWLTDKNNGEAKFYGEGFTLDKYPLIIGTKYNIPFLLHKSGEGNHVVGEIYEIDETMMSNLDILEDHPNFYERTVIQIRKDSEVLDCWTYFIKKFNADLLKKETFVSYSSKGPHNLPYLERYLREPSYDFKSEILGRG